MLFYIANWRLELAGKKEMIWRQWIKIFGSRKYITLSSVILLNDSINIFRSDFLNLFAERR